MVTIKQGFLRSSFALVSLVYGLAACQDEPPRVDLFDYFATVPGSFEEADTAMLMPFDLIAADTFFVILDRATPDIRVLTSDARLIRSIGRKGAGPGEFVEITGADVSPSDQRIAVADARNQRISFWGLDGTFAYEVPLGPGQVGAIAYDVHGRLHLNRMRPPGNSQEAGSPLVTVFLADGSSVYSYGTYAPSDDPFARMMLNEVRFARSHGLEPDHMWLLYPHRAQLEQWSLGGERLRVLDLPWPLGFDSSAPFTEQDPTDPLTVLINRVPAATDVAVDSSGWIYIGLYHSPPDRPSATELLAYDPEGNLRSRLMLDYTLRTLSVSGNRLYGLQAGHRVLPGVVIFELRRPEGQAAPQGVSR